MILLAQELPVLRQDVRSALAAGSRPARTGASCS